MKSGEDVESDMLEMLLEDIRQILGDTPVIHTRSLLDRLKGLDDRPWGTWGKRSEGINEYHLRRLLKPLQIKPPDMGNSHPSTGHVTDNPAKIGAVDGWTDMKSTLNRATENARCVRDIGEWDGR